MSTVRKSVDSATGRPTEDHPFRYGYRNVVQTDEHGRQQIVMIPLTEIDVLHPRLEDHITQNQPHVLDCFYLLGTFQMAVVDHPDALVLCDHLIKWDVPGMGDHGPDIAVVFGVRQQQPRPPSFDVIREGVRPDLIIEITSPATRNSDLNVKPNHYWQVGVPYYVIVDELPRRRQRQLRILGYRRGKRGYRPMRLNEQGRLWLDTVQLWLGHDGGRVVCYNRQGLPIPDRVQAEQVRVQAEQERVQAEERAAQETLARKRAEAEVARLQEELRRLRGEK